MNLSAKQTQRQRQQTCGYQRGGEEGADRLGLYGVRRCKTITFSMDKQQGPSV